MSNQQISTQLLTVEETARYLNLSARTIYNRVAPKAKNPFPIRPKRIGRKILFHVQDIERFVQSL